MICGGVQQVGVWTRAESVASNPDFLFQILYCSFRDFSSIKAVKQNSEQLQGYRNFLCGGV